MNRMFEQITAHAGRWIAAGIVALLALAIFSSGVWGAGPSTVAPAAGPPQAVPQATPGQDFQDVVPSNGFYSYLHNLYQAGVVGGYGCGSTNPPEPCVPPDNLPYYRPNNAVTRLQMSKFIDLGRRNIADAIGHSLYISTTAGIAVDAETRSGG